MTQLKQRWNEPSRFELGGHRIEVVIKTVRDYDIEINLWRNYGGIVKRTTDENSRIASKIITLFDVYLNPNYTNMFIELQPIQSRFASHSTHFTILSSGELTLERVKANVAQLYFDTTDAVKVIT